MIKLLKNAEVIRKLDKITKELFPDLSLEFYAHYNNYNIFTTYINMTNAISVHKYEVTSNDPKFDELNLRRILIIRIIEALINL